MQEVTLLSLEKYAKKRRFKDTPEPPPRESKPSAVNIFCVQRHEARRLHYDLRLEIGEALKSWAVPEGPTLDPSIKRLAVHVEDHPLEYGGFEGNIPKGNYGAGSVMLWDRGTYELADDLDAERQIGRGDLKFTLHGEKLRGLFALVRMKDGEWLLLKKKDAEARAGWNIESYAWSVTTRRTQEEIALELPGPRLPDGALQKPMPGKIEPMMAALAGDAPQGDGWIYEVKWDGVRALCFVDSNGVRASSRKGTAITAQYPEVGQLSACVSGGSAILDGEIVATDEAGRPSFERLQPRIMAADPSKIARLSRSRPVAYYIFDLLYWNGFDLRSAALVARQAFLRRVVRESERVKLSLPFEVPPEHLMHAVREQGLEGIVAKRADSRYRGGRSQEWLKIKATREQDCVICGYSEGEREHFGGLLLGVYSNGSFEFAGSVGTGFDAKAREAIRERLDKLRAKRHPYRTPPPANIQATWVRPELICRVRYLEWTSEGRLRAPVYLGLRDDIDPADCKREDAAPASTQPLRPPPLLPASGAEARLKIDGHLITFTNLGKPMFPADGFTKRDVIEYYNAVAPLLIPHWRDRPLSLRRYPDGIEKEGFFQKNVHELPDWIRREQIIAEDGEERWRAVGGGRAELLYLAHLGCIDQNPWMSRIGSLDNADFLLIDLDPNECSFDQIVEAARYLRGLLDQIGLEGFPKTTGGDGMHIYVPLDPVHNYEQTRSFTEVLARLAASARPDLFTLPRGVSRREKGKVYFDYLQNGRGKTISAPYVLRAHPGAPVATPLEWREVTQGLRPAQFHIRNALDRFQRVGDLFARVLTLGQRLDQAMPKLAEIIARS
jgi:bifunctional non-homologous end joining protein LigD